MRIAILGAGFCGLATAWYLAQQNGPHEIVVIDPVGIGKGTSGVAAGLLHMYAGARSRKNWRADEGLAATLKLIAVAEQYLSHKVIRKTGLQRSALTPQQQADFKQCTQDHQDVIWRSAAQCRMAVPYVADAPGIFIEEAYIVDCERYLQGLWMACAHAGVTLQNTAVKSLAEVGHFDAVVIAMGAAANSLPELADLPITPIKGQVLTLEWPSKYDALPFPISSQVYMLMHPQKKTLIAGATFERHFADALPNINTALEDIIPKVQELIPDFGPANVLSCRAGIRASAPMHRPYVKHLGNRRWVLTGMGSKGLLYHALFAHEVASRLG